MENKVSKRAIKRYLKNRPLPSKSDSWTPFRAAEKRYMSKFSSLDLSGVLDLALLEGQALDDCQVKGRSDIIDVDPVDLCREDARSRKAFIVPQFPGLVVLPNYLTHDEQRSLIRWSLADQARSPNDTNLDIHYNLPEEGLWNRHARACLFEDGSTSACDDYIIQPKRPTGAEIPNWPPVGPRTLIDNMPANPSNFGFLDNQAKDPLPPSSHLPPTHVSKLLNKLRWANIGYVYHWGSKTYDFTKPKVEYPQNIRRICKDVVAAVNWQKVWTGVDNQDWGENGPDWDTWQSNYEPDAGIVNFYQPKDTLCGHVDRSEVCSTSPLVSISLGNAAVFLIGGLTRSVTPLPILLRSGDIIVMSGPGCRRAYHGVPRILEGTSPAHLQSSADDEGWKPFGKYMDTARININVRQVFPRGFDPFGSPVAPNVTTHEDTLCTP